MKKVLIINGPNLNMLGKRESNIYGDLNYEELNKKLESEASDKEISLTVFQSNHEGEIVDRIQSAPGEFALVIINPGGFTHTSVAIRDAFLAVEIPFIEVHISNIYNREKFRQHSYLSDIASGIVAGFGVESYSIALNAAEKMLSKAAP